MQLSRYGLVVVLHSITAALVWAAATPAMESGGLILPPGFRASIVADDLMASRASGNGSDALRFIAVSPSGDLYGKTSRGGILALRDADGDGRYETKQEFGGGGGTGIALRDGWLYHSTDSAVYRYALRPGELVPAGEPERIVSGLPNEHSHTSKAFAFDGEGRLLVEVGSPHNVYSDGDRQLGAKGKDPTEYLKTHGGFWRFDPEKQNQTQSDGFHFSTGHRHSLAIAWQPVAREFFMVMMGRDGLNTVAPDYYDALDNAERVAEELHRLKEGVNLGWPYTYWDPFKKARMINPEFGGDGRKRAEVGKYDEPLVAFPAHWAPLQMQFYTGTQFPERYRGGAFVAFHGSWNRAPLPQDGFNVCFVPFDEKGAPLGSFEVFAANAGPERFRMGGVAVGPDGSLFISETDRGRIWRISYGGESAGAERGVNEPATAAALKVAPTSANTKGRQVYEQLCATCHMPDGSGAGQLQPPLIGSKIVSGDPARLIAVVLRGPAAVLPPDRPKYGNIMPPFSVLGDEQLADLLSYVREVFGKEAGAIRPEAVARNRAEVAP